MMDMRRLPDSMAEWMRAVERRFRRLERHRHAPPSSLRPPGWTITTDAAGNLVARPDNGAPDVVLAPAP